MGCRSDDHFCKILLLQIPGWILTALILLGLHHWLGLPFWLTSGLFVGLVVKDFIWYPSMRTAYESNVRTGAEQLIDAQGVVQTELNPQGYVQVRGELWRAEVEPDAASIARGSSVRVQAAQPGQGPGAWYVWQCSSEGVTDGLYRPPVSRPWSSAVVWECRCQRCGALRNASPSLVVFVTGCVGVPEFP